MECPFYLVAVTEHGDVFEIYEILESREKRREIGAVRAREALDREYYLWWIADFSIFTV